MIVDQVMTLNPKCLPGSAKSAEADELMRSMNFRHIPVISETGVLIGMLSSRDLQRHEMRPEIRQEFPKMSQALDDMPISKMMHQGIICVPTGTEIVEVIDIMVSKKIGAIPVVDPITDRLVGIISYIDVLKAARDKLASN